MTGVIQLPVLEWDAKSPESDLDFTFDWTNVLATGENVASYVLSKDDTALIIASDGNTANQVIGQLQGGTNGKVANVKCVMTTDAAPPRVYSRTAFLPIMEQ